MSEPQVFSYLRFSSDKQAEGDSIERQRELTSREADRLGLSSPIEIRDEALSAWSGANLATGELARFADRVRSGEVVPNSILIVEKMDRLSRIEPMDAFAWVVEMTNHGLRIVTAMDHAIYDRDAFRSPAMIGKVVQLLAQQQGAHDYSNTISTRVKGAIKRKRKEVSEGKRKLISAHLPGWLTAEGDGDQRQAVVIPERAATVVLIYQLAADGLGARGIAKELNKRGIPPFGRGHHHKRSGAYVGWEHTYIADILASPAVEGDYEPGEGRRRQRAKTGERFENYFPRIEGLDADLIARARAGVLSRKGKGGNGTVRLNNLFTGIVRCGHCYGKMTLVGNSQKPARYLTCMNASRGRTCPQKKLFAYKPFETAALDAMLHLALDDRFFERPNDTQRLAVELAEVNKAIATKTERAKRLARFIATQDDAPEAETEYRDIRVSIRESETRRDELDRQIIAASGALSPEEHMRRVLDVRSSLDHFEDDIRLAARRKVSQAIASVVDYVHCEIERDEKQFTLVMAGGVHAIRFNNDGAVIGEVDVNRQLEPFSALIWNGQAMERVSTDPANVVQALTGGDPIRLERLASYRRRRKAS